MAKAIVIDSTGKAEVRDMSELADYQHAVGGLIERISLDGRRGLYVHHNGRNLPLPLNRRVSAMVGWDIYGPAVMIQTDENGDPQDLPQRMIDRIDEPWE